ncbi:hypothetical protein J7E93_05775 [Streptomyces sp. ISL-36]|uniref:hypothetical protein n=1 Tax=Streptomyces sp. ISL-36 TaxID=2819182 RepID=UPI001BEA1251|nr:hypothetical protein [Streptomyces sp. ISL-36]MBT2439637.1 hypothetical protein [Streptomyces sp. ISL-36]
MSRAGNALAVAVTTVLAPTATPAAFAAAAQQEQEQQGQLSFPQNSAVISAGTTGFLTRGTEADKLLWTRYADGSTTEIEGTSLGSTRSDTVVVRTAPDLHRFYDMAASGEPTTLDPHFVAVGPVRDGERAGLLAIGPTGSTVYHSPATWAELPERHGSTPLYSGETAAFDDYS